jgi:acetate kinase
MPGVPMVAVFDTAFHQTMPEEAYLYGLPYRYYEKYAVRRYGFHGTSHDFVSQRVAELLGRDRKDMKIIVCHLGNGASICAVKNGKSVETSMGFTPLEGLVMGTRCGDIDPAILEFIAGKENLDIAGLLKICNKESGVMGVSGVSSDFRDLHAVERENHQARAALDIFSYSVLKYIGAYAAVMNGVDAIAFTAGCGENDPHVRAHILRRLEYLGCYLDPDKNDCRSKEQIISTDDSKVVAMVVPTNEELAIARETVALV